VGVLGELFIGFKISRQKETATTAHSRNETSTYGDFYNGGEQSQQINVWMREPGRPSTAAQDLTS
jgi:hypothetical protein